jgi:hypothetical protein
VDVEVSEVCYIHLKEVDASKNINQKKRLGCYPSIEDLNSFSTRAKSYISCALGRVSG